MQTISMSYAERFRNNQQESDEPVEILDLDASIVPAREAAAFRRRLHEENPELTKWAVITLWESGEIPANEAIYWLQISNQIGSGWHFLSPNEFLRGYVARERALAEGGR